MPQISTVSISNFLSFLTAKRESPNVVRNLMLEKPKGAGEDSVGAPIAEQLAPRV